MGETLVLGDDLRRVSSTDLAPATCNETVNLAVDGMHCGTCMRTVEDTLGALPGVTLARVNLSTRRALVAIDANRITSERLIEALAKRGYTAVELRDMERHTFSSSHDDLLRRLGVAGFAAMNIMLLSVSVWSGTNTDMDSSVQTLFHWLSALIALPAVAYAGQPFFSSALKALKHRRLNMDVPISLGVILATGMSVYQTLRGSEQVYFDAAITLLAFLLLGRLLDEQMRAKATSAAGNLLGLKSVSASVIRQDGSVARVPVKTIQPGMRVIASIGERIPADGRVVQGDSEIDQSLITGESIPHKVQCGDQVYAGTINLGQSLIVEVTRRDANSLLSEIAQLMSAAEQNRGLYVRLADRAARLYAPAVHSLGLSTFVGWLAMGHPWQDALTAAIAVLIITCPCALALAVPAVQVAAASRLFSKGIILKAADGLERLAEADTVVFDKTGTLTLGQPRLANDEAVSDETLASAASLAAASRHPYACAVVAAAEARHLNIPVVNSVQEVSGSGLLRVTADGAQRLGSARWCGITTKLADTPALWFKPHNGNAVALQFKDEIRSDGAAVVAALNSAGFRVELLSGDATAEVARLAQQAGIASYFGEQRPEQKISHLERLKAQGRKVLMVGDGLNDAPALAAAHASLSPAHATDIAQTASDAIFQGSRLAPVIEAIAVAQGARRLALQNFALAIAYNIVFVPLAMVGLVTPLIAAIAMSASSITVTANAVRLRTQNLKVSA
jgi:Cu2+-exporting ATPase